MDLGLKGKTIFITGGSSGIGKATAIAYGKETGAQVAFSYFKNKEKAENIVRTIEENGGKAMAVLMDMGDTSSIEKAVNAIFEKWNGIDVLVNNAVHWGNPANRGKKLEEMPLEQWEEMFKINLLGMVKIIQMVVPYMRQKKWGRIVNLSSDIAKDSMQGSGPYGSLKAALFGLTANLVEELSADGILSNVVLPSWTLTERAKNFFPESFQEAAIKAFPTRRVTVPEDVASLILYLGSAANGHVNGEHIMVTGKGSQPMLSSMFREYMAKT
jgi:3-oxoacyl-[acyl-carrier protein] reductase